MKYINMIDQLRAHQREAYSDLKNAQEKLSEIEKELFEAKKAVAGYDQRLTSLLATIKAYQGEPLIVRNAHSEWTDLISE